MSLANGRVGTDLYIVLGIGATRSDQTDPEDPIRFHQFDVSSDVIVIIYSESSCRRILKTSEI